MNQGEIYIIKNKLNDKLYIGQVISISSNGRKRGTYKRWSDHVNRAISEVNECPLLEAAIRKYGKDNFQVETLLLCSCEKLNYYEGLFIKTYNSLSPNGYNLRIEGENGRLHSEETKKKMSQTRTGKKHAKQTKDKIGIAHKNKNVSDETRKKIGETSKLRNMSSDNREQLEKRLLEINIERLPMYILYTIDKRYKNKLVDGLIVKKPGLQTKKFFSQQLSFKEKLDKAIQYINSFNL